MLEPGIIWWLQGGKGKAERDGAGAGDSDSAVAQAPEALGEASEVIKEQAQQLLPESLQKDRRPHELDPLQIGLALAVIIVAFALRSLVVLVIARLYNRAIRPPRPGPFMISPAAAQAQEERKRAVERLLRVATYVILLSGLFFALSLLDLPTEPTNWERSAWQIYTSLLLVFAGALLFQLFGLVLRVFTRERPGLDSGIFDRQLTPLIRDIAKFAVGILVILLILQTWGYDTTALLAGVGIGGLAIAFAAQDAIANVFGSLVIYSDRPYKVGDWVRVSDVEGIVEEIGIRSTRIRLFDKSMVSVPNKSVAGEKIHNFSAMTHRRIKMVIGLPYETAAEDLVSALAVIREVVAWQRGIESDTWVVHLTEFGTSSQNILVQCFTRVTRWEDYLKIQEELLLEIRRRLDILGIRIAIPTQTVIYRAEGAHGMDGDEPGSPASADAPPPPMRQ
ncbi:mechanosensitive ion channel family protein [bacterium]|nr:mechanosensitive ion channel family protein [bacterium]